MPRSTSLGGLPQYRCHMLSLLFPGPESHINIGNCNMMIWYGLPGQCNSTSSRVGEWICSKILMIAVLHIYCNFAFKNAICLQGDLAASVMATKIVYSEPRLYTKHENCSWFTPSLPVRLVPDPTNTFLSNSIPKLIVLCKSNWFQHLPNDT